MRLRRRFGSDGDPAGGGTPAGGVTDAGCTTEIKRQLADPSKATKDVPPQCKGISDDRLAELFNSAMQSVVGTNAPTASPRK